MTQQTAQPDRLADIERTTSLADIAGVVIDLAKVPNHEPGTPTGGFHVRSTGRGYETPDGDVARCELVSDQQQ